MPQALPSAPRRLLTASLICLLSGAVLATDWQALNRVAQASAEQQAEAQREIEKLDDEAKKHFAEYRAQLIELDGLQTYNRQLKALRDEQDAALAELDERIQKTGRLDRKIIPLLEDMYSALVLFIEQDLPFLQRERKDRLAQLRHILDDPEVTLAAKYRSLYEAYQIELDYGRTLESYSDMLELEGETRAVTILRIGRIGLYSISGDRERVFTWNRDTIGWDETEGIARHVQKAIRMAKKQIAPDLLTLPVPRPEEAP